MDNYLERPDLVDYKVVSYSGYIREVGGYYDGYIDFIFVSCDGRTTVLREYKTF